jgi:integrase
MPKRRANHEGSIRQRTDGTWEAILSVGRDPLTGKLKRVSYYGKTQREVVEKAARAKAARAQGTYVKPEKLTLGQWLAEWLETYKAPRVRALSLAQYQRIITRHLTPALGHLLLTKLHPEDVQRYLNRKQQTLDAVTLRQHLVVLRSALAMAQKVGRVSRNVAQLVETPTAARKRRETLSIVQVTTQLLPALTDDRYLAAYVVLFLTGLRKGELLGLRWQDIDFEARTLQVHQTLERVPNPHGTKPKTVLAFMAPKTEQSRRTVALPEECVSALRQHKARQAAEKLRLGAAYSDQGLVFCQGDGRPIDPRTFNYHFVWTLKQAGLPHIRVHDARHTYATRLLQHDVPLKVVSTQLGHSSIAITGDIYSHVTAEVARKAADALQTAFTASQ